MSVLSDRPPTGGRHARLVTAVLGLAGLLGFVGLLVLGMTAERGLPFRSSYVLRGDFQDLSTLSRAAEVRIAGRRVGRVRELTAKTGGKASLVLELDPELRPLRSDTRLRIRPKGLLGAQFIDLTPGKNGRPLPDEATIPVEQTSASVELSEVFDTLDAPRRARLQTTLRELGQGVLGRGEDINGFLADATPLVADLRRLAEAVEARSGAAKRLFPSAASAAAAYEPVRDQAAQGFEPSARALEPFARQRTAVQDTLEEAPPALSALRVGARKSEPLLAEAQGLSRALDATLEPAPATLRQVDALLRESRTPLRRLEPVLDRAGEAAPSVVRFADRITPVLPVTTSTLGDSVPTLRTLGRYDCDVSGFVRNWHSMLSYGVPGGGEIGPLNFIRYELVATDETLARPDDDGALRGGRNPYPDPCEAGTETVPR